MPIVTGLISGRGRIQTQDSLMPRPVAAPSQPHFPWEETATVMNQELAYQGQRAWSPCPPGGSGTLTEAGSSVAVVGSSEGGGGWALA